MTQSYRVYGSFELGQPAAENVRKQDLKRHPVDPRLSKSTGILLIAISGRRKEKLKMARILVVDDEVNSVKLVSMAIGLMGHESLEAYRGEQAVEMISSEKPDLVLLDYMMPGMNGLETLSRLKSTYADCPPVYMLTAAQDYYVKDQVMAGGATGWFTKPLDLEELESVISDAVRVPVI